MQPQQYIPVSRAQRTCAALLLIVLWLPLLSVLAAGLPAEAALPACCRAHGMHHCALSSDGSPADHDTAAAPHLSQRCPYQNPSASLAHIPVFYGPETRPLFHPPIVARASLASYLALSFPVYEAHRTRGPPLPTLPA